MNVKKVVIIVSTILVVLFFSCFIVYKFMFISKSDVKDIVVEHAGIKMKDVKKWNIEFDYEDGMFIYDVEVIFNNQEYDYEINARTGEVIIYKLEN